MIHILDRQTERILDVLVNQSDSKIYWDTKMTEAIEDNVLIFEFRMLADSPAAKHIIPKNKLTAQDQDGFHRLFIIDSVETTHDANGKVLFVSALGDHIELASEEPIPPQTLAGQTAETAVQFVLANTRYQPGQIDFAGSRTLTFDTYTNPLAALQKIASVFDLELRFRVNVNPDGSITRIVDLLKPDDVFDGKEIVFGKDMTGIRRKENTENICTRLIGVGPADEDGNLVTFASVNGGKIYVEDEEAFQRWNNAGRHIWGIFEYQPEDDTEVTPQQLLDATKKEMEKRKNSVVEWEVSAAALEQVIGLEHERVRVGMNVRIKDEAFDPAIYLEARVLETEMPELDDPNGNFSYTFGNYRQVTVVVPPEVKAIQKTLFQKANAWTAAKSIAAQALADAARAQETADGKITSFYQPDPPATASEGDLWFDTDDGNKPYIWRNGQWVNAQDSGIAEALNRANDAQATADKKVQTFFSETQPTAEGIGDLWYNPASGALFRWSGSAWELVSDVTGRNTAADTAKVGGKPSITVLNDISSAQSAANAAQQAANAAQQAANAANAMLADISSDSKLTPVEKQATKKEWDTIVSEKPTIEAQADTYGITTEKTNYVNAYNALNSYITPLLADLNTTSTIDGNAFRSKFKDYYDARTALLKKITDLAKQKADAAQQTANQAKQTADNSVQKGTLYNGVSISETDGFKVTRSDQLVQAVFNATEGIRYQTRPNTSSPWQDDFYYDVNTKRFKFAGELEGASGTFGTVSVKDGDFIMTDSVTGASYSVVTKTNLIKDHSFETLQPTGNIGADNLFAVGNAGEWIKTGTPKLTTNEGRESGRTEAIFGNQAVVVNNANYVETIMSYMRMARGAVHTISLYAKKPAAYSAGIPRIYLYVYNEGLGGSKTVLWSTTLTANSAPPSDYRPARYIFNFTMPNITSSVDTYTQFGIRVLSSNSNWVIIDGIQLVEGAIAGPYDAENSFFDFMNGYLPVRRLNSTGEIIARGWVYTDAIDSNPYSSGIHLYLRPTSSGEVRATRTGTTDSYVPVRASNVYTNSVDINNLTSSVHLYARPTSGGNLRVTASGTTDVWRPVEAASFQNRSLERYKQDIELWNGSALDIIRNSEIYQYRLKTDVQNGIDKLKYGFIIGEGYRTPHEVITHSGESVDIYVQSSVAWKAIQELDSVQMNHEDRIATLEAKIAELEAKIS